jgi:hypothetical protein
MTRVPDGVLHSQLFLGLGPERSRRGWVSGVEQTLAPNRTGKGRVFEDAWVLLVSQYELVTDVMIPFGRISLCDGW